MTLAQLYAVVPDKPKATIRGVLNINVGKHFNRVSEGTYDIIRAPKGGAKKPAPSKSGAAKTAAKPAAKSGAKAASGKAGTSGSKAKPAAAKTGAAKASNGKAASKPAQTTTKGSTAKK